VEFVVKIAPGVGPAINALVVTSANSAHAANPTKNIRELKNLAVRERELLGQVYFIVFSSFMPVHAGLFVIPITTGETGVGL
jgi:hypothetical protein